MEMIDMRRRAATTNMGLGKMNSSKSTEIRRNVVRLEGTWVVYRKYGWEAGFAWHQWEKNVN